MNVQILATVFFNSIMQFGLRNQDSGPAKTRIEGEEYSKKSAVKMEDFLSVVSLSGDLLAHHPHFERCWKV